MTVRRRRLLALLWSLRDLEPGPASSWGQTASGPGPARRQPCPDCGGIELTDEQGHRLKAWKGTGQVSDRFGRPVPCRSCGGTDEAAGTGWIYVDRMVGKGEQVRTTETVPTRPAMMVRCDACAGEGTGLPHLRDPADPESEYRDPCSYCNGSGKRAVTAKIRIDQGTDENAGPELISLDVKLATLRGKGSYDELTVALKEVARVHPSALAAVIAIHVERVMQPTEGSHGWHLVEFGLLCLERRLPTDLRVPGQVWKAWQQWQDRQGRTLAVGQGAGSQLLERRDKEIRRLIREGKPSQWVAAEYGLSVATVNRIAAGHSEQVA